MRPSFTVNKLYFESLKKLYSPFIIPVQQFFLCGLEKADHSFKTCKIITAFTLNPQKWVHL